MAITYRLIKGTPLTLAEHDENFSHLDTIKANKAITVTGTNGLTGGGDLSANRTLALGIPSTLTTTSTNSASGETHNHALDLSERFVLAGGGLVGGGDLNSDRTLSVGTPSTLTTTSTNSTTSTSHNHELNLSGRSIIAGNGLTGGGDLDFDRTLSVGTPSTISTGSTNSTTSTSHNHALDLSGRVISSGSYLTGGGNLGSNRTLNVDASTGATANKVAARDSAADIHARLFRSEHSDDNYISGAIAFRVNNTSNNYIRFCDDIPDIRTYLNVPSKDVAIGAGLGLRGGGTLATSRNLYMDSRYGFLGTYVLGYVTRTGFTENTLISGSLIQPFGFVHDGIPANDTSYGSSTTKGGAYLSGTWRTMGRSMRASTATWARATLFMRVD